MPYLPVAPLVPHLRCRIDRALTDNGPPASGIESVAWDISRVSGCDVASARKQIYRVLSGKQRCMHDWSADVFAAALRMHPVLIWSDWYDITDAGVREHSRDTGAA